MNNKHSIWVEKYRPTILEDYIISEEIKNKFQSYIEKQDIPHLGFFSKSPGCGKTTLARILAKNIECDFLYINAVDERGMDIMREKIGGFASSSSFKPLKIVILDESTSLLQNSQLILLNMIETYSAKTRFVLTGNYPERLVDPLRSRLNIFKLDPPSKPIVASHLTGILDKENIRYDLKDVALVVKKFFPDMRRMINFLQTNSITGELTISSTSSTNLDYNQLILSELSQQKPKFNTIRQIINNADLSDYTEVFRMIYDNSSKLFPGSEGQVAIFIAEAEYKSNFSLDKEINFMSFISQLLTLK